jgi:hypothetical protein
VFHLRHGADERKPDCQPMIDKGILKEYQEASRALLKYALSDKYDPAERAALESRQKAAQEKGLRYLWNEFERLEHGNR